MFIGLGIGIPVTRSGATPAYDPDAEELIAKYGQPSFLFDFGKTDRTFQDATGATLADDAGEAVALALDSAQWGGKTLAEFVAGQLELAPPPLTGAQVSGTFAVNADNVVGGSGFTGYINIGKVPIAAAVYQATFTVSGTGSSGVGFRLGSTNWSGGGTAYGPFLNGTRTLYVAASQVLSARMHWGSWVADGGTISNISVKEIPGFHGLQSGSAGFRPTRRADSSLEGDANDDRLILTRTAVASGNLLMGRVVMPAAPSATQVIAGLMGASAGRFAAGIQTGTGYLAAGFGTTSIASGAAAALGDLRGQTGTFFLLDDGTLIHVGWNGVVGYSVARTGNIDTTVPFALWANNANGTPGSFFGGKIKDLMFTASGLPTLAEIQSVSNKWNAKP